MACIVTTMVIVDEDGVPLEDQCTLCLDLTPWIVDVRAMDTLIHICIECARNISLACLDLKEQMADSRA